MRTYGRLMIATTFALALSACGKKEEAPAAAATETAAAPAAAVATMPSPGTYEVTDAAGKKVTTNTINADGTYASDLANGQRVAGIVKMVDGKVCFDPSGKAEAACFTDGPAGPDGSFTSTDAAGAVLTVRPVAK
jgi:hypothetical protein